VTSVQAGQTATVRVRAARSGALVREGEVVAQFWRPGHDPGPGGYPPDKQAACRFDEAARGWVADVDTTGWEPGTWKVRGLARDPADRQGWAMDELVITT
jgi:hypothetical protein